MPYTPNVDQLQPTNSTTYADLLGLQVGLDRLPGEKSTDYLKRIETAARTFREHPYEGCLNELSLQLGFSPSPYIHVELSSSDVMSVSISGIKINADPAIPLLEFDNDSMWKWRTLSDVVNNLNNVVSSTLLVNDGPAFQLARQSNSNWIFDEAVTNIQNRLQRGKVVPSTVTFNQSVPFSLSSDGLLIFTTEPPVGTTITYNYLVQSYDIVGSPISVIGLKDPEFPSVANAPDGSLAYQVREFVQNVMLVDRSYWAR